MTDVLLIKPPCEHSVLPPLGLGYLSSALKKQGISSKIIHGSKDNLDVAGVMRIIEEQNFNIIGVSCCSNDHLWLLELVRNLETQPHVSIPPPIVKTETWGF